MPLVVCLLTVAAVFGVTVGFEFVNWDDDLHVTANPLVVGEGAGLAELLLTPRLVPQIFRIA